LSEFLPVEHRDMKPASFEYHRASSLAEACAVLAGGDGEDERKVIAGGQTLVPLMAMRLTRPTLLVDINRLDELAGIEKTGERIAIGAMTRQRALERSPLVADELPLLAAALAHVGHVQTRNRGTIGGSVVHGDPSAEIPLVAMVLGARLKLASSAGVREVEAGAFFEGLMATAIRDDEILTALEFPVPARHGRTGCSFHEVAPRHGDFAIVSAAAQITLDDAGRCVDARLGIGGCAATPLRLADAEAALAGRAPDDDDIAAVLAILDGAIEPNDTPHASAAYRRRVAPELLRRAIDDALKDAAA
jgi:CO/xanthine dehydrogenase FAD-binding subunit